MAAKDVTAWEAFFHRYTRLTARYAVERLSARGDTAYAAVRTLYTFVPAGGGAQRGTRLPPTIPLVKTPDRRGIPDIPHAPLAPPAPPVPPPPRGPGGRPGC